MLGTRLCWGREEVISGSLLSVPTGREEGDRHRRLFFDALLAPGYVGAGLGGAGARVLIEQLPQSRARALGDLAVLLHRPAVCPTEVGAIDVGEPAREQKALIRGELV